MASVPVNTATAPFLHYDPRYYGLLRTPPKAVRQSQPVRTPVHHLPYGQIKVDPHPQSRKTRRQVYSTQLRSNPLRSTIHLICTQPQIRAGMEPAGGFHHHAWEEDEFDRYAKQGLSWYPYGAVKYPDQTHQGTTYYTGPKPMEYPQESQPQPGPCYPEFLYPTDLRAMRSHVGSDLRSMQAPDQSPVELRPLQKLHQQPQDGQDQVEPRPLQWLHEHTLRQAEYMYGSKLHDLGWGTPAVLPHQPPREPFAIQPGQEWRVAFLTSRRNPATKETFAVQPRQEWRVPLFASRQLDTYQNSTRIPVVTPSVAPANTDVTAPRRSWIPRSPGGHRNIDDSTKPLARFWCDPLQSTKLVPYDEHYLPHEDKQKHIIEWLQTKDMWLPHKRSMPLASSPCPQLKRIKEHDILLSGLDALLELEIGTPAIAKSEDTMSED